jgi:hypothetical protein
MRLFYYIIIETEGSFPCSLESTTDLYPDPDESSPQIPP